ncbi:MAG: serine/threonine-protein kinase PknK [Myxococcales bacterium]
MLENQDEGELSIGQLMRAARPLDEVSPPVPGQVLCNGRIRLGPKIGSGGMGTVFAAWDNDKPIALKTLRRSAPCDIYRLKSEFRRLSALVHPHLVMVHQLIVEDGLWFFTMERVNGRPLHLYWQELPEKSPNALRGLVKQLVEGISAIHEAGLLHRDIKPSNIMVEPNGRVVILDFGLVSDREPGGEGHTMPGQLCGTPAYMAPERLLGQPSTEANDWYAAGVVLWELLTGKSPVTAPLSAAMYEERRAPPSIQADARYADTELIGLCQSLLHPSPTQRPTSQQLLAQVRSWSVTSTPSTQVAPVVAKRDVFVGRANYLRELQQAYHRALRGKPSIVWLSGASGMGKSRLLRCFGEYLSGIDSPVVLRGQCLECESVPHNAFDSVVDHFSRVASQLPESEVAQLVPKQVRYLAKLFPVLLRIGPMEAAIRVQTTNVEAADVLVQRSRAISSLKDLLYRLAERRRLVLFLDDMQWADQDSINLLKELTQPPDPPYMLVVAASRTEISPLVFGEEVTIPLKLEPMTDQETLELASVLLPADAPDRDACLRSIAQQCEGLPIYVAEMARAFASTTTEGGVEPRSLSWLFQRNIRSLDPESLDVLTILAAACRRVDLPLVEAMLKRPVTRSVRTLRQQLLISSELVDGQEYLGMAHDQVRLAALEVIDQTLRTEAHSKIADVLLERHESEWGVSQLIEAKRLDEAAEHAAEAAAASLQRLAFENATEWFALALTAKGRPPHEICELRIQYAQALSCAGQCDLAAQQYLLAAGMRSNQTESATLRAKAATQWLRAGFIEQGISVLRMVLGELGIAWPESTLTTLAGFAWHRVRIRLGGTLPKQPVQDPPEHDLLAKLEALTPASTVLGTFDYLRGAYFSALALPLALRSGSPRHVLNALASEAVYRVMMDGVNALESAREQIQRIESMTMPPADEAYRQGIVALVQAMTAYWSGNWGLVDASAKTAEAWFEGGVPGSSWELTLLRSIRHTARTQSNPAEVGREIPALLREATRHHDRYSIADLLRTQVMVQLSERRVDRARETFHRLESENEQAPLASLQHLVLAARVQVALELGNPAEARTVFERQWQECRKLGMNRFPLVRCAAIGIEADLLEASHELNSKTRSKQLRELARRAAKQPIAFADALASSIGASADKLDGDSQGALTRMARASQRYRECGLELSALTELLATPTGCESPLVLTQRGVGDPVLWRSRRRCLF